MDVVERYYEEGNESTYCYDLYEHCMHYTPSHISIDTKSLPKILERSISQCRSF